MPDPGGAAAPAVDLDADLAQAQAIGAEAAALLLAGFGAGALRTIGRRQVASDKGAPNDLVTEFDRRAEALIVGRLRAAFPDDAIVGEEGGLQAVGRGPAPARWLIDPLDGTTNFAHGLPVFCVSMARERGGRLELAVVVAPALSLSLWARRGGGAFGNGERLTVSPVDSLARALCATGFPYDRTSSYENNFEQFAAVQRRAQAVRRLGSAALDLALVAAGSYDAYWEMKLKPWDMAAGALLVEEAGGRVSGWQGEPLSPDATAVVASNGRVHGALLEVLAQLPLPAAARTGPPPAPFL